MSPSDFEVDAGARPVDFVVGHAAPISDDADDELPEPARNPWLRRMLAGGAVALVAGILIVRAVTSTPKPTTSAALPSSGRSSQASTSSGSPTEVSPDGRPIVVSPAAHFPVDISISGRGGPMLAPPTVALDATTGKITDCPELSACTLSRTVPADLVDAIRASFPTARVRSVTTIFGLRDGDSARQLLQRTVVAQAGSTRIDIDLHAATSDGIGVSGTGTDAKDEISYVHDLVPGFAVAVEARWPRPAAAVPLVTLDVLANQSRLLAQ